MIKAINTPNIPVNDGELFFKWLGSFWSKLYEDTAFIHGYTSGMGVLSSQLYLDFLEKINLMSIEDAPLYHREQWYPMSISSLDKNKTKGTSIKLSMDPPVVLGPQPSSTEYDAGKTYKLGGYVSPRNFIAYPLDSNNISDIVTCIVDSIVSPSIVLIKGQDFYIEGSTLYVKKDKDPFVLDEFKKVKYIENGVDNFETVLWCCDTLVDKKYLNDHFGYVIGINLESTEYSANIIQAIWDIYVTGYPITVFLTAIASILNIEYIKNDSIILDIIDDPFTEEKLLVTDRRVYRYSKDSTFKPNIVKGAMVYYGEIPVTSVIFINHLGRYVNDSFTRDTIKELQLAPSFFKCELEHGFNLSWGKTPIRFVGIDSNNNPKYKFDLVGSESDKDVFWEYLWKSVEDNKVSCNYLFKDYLNKDITLWKYNEEANKDQWVGVVKSIDNIYGNNASYRVELEEAYTTMEGGYLKIGTYSFKILKVEDNYIYVNGGTILERLKELPYSIRYSVTTNGVSYGNLEMNQTVGTIRPLEFFIKTYIGANSSFLLIDSSCIKKESHVSMMAKVQKLLPSYGYLFIQLNTKVDKDNYDLSSVDDIVQISSSTRLEDVAGKHRNNLWYADAGVTINYITECK